jgi:hypothetical protein
MGGLDAQAIARATDTVRTSRAKMCDAGNRKVVINLMSVWQELIKRLIQVSSMGNFLEKSS